MIYAEGIPMDDQRRVKVCPYCGNKKFSKKVVSMHCLRPFAAESMSWERQFPPCKCWQCQILRDMRGKDSVFRGWTSEGMGRRR